MSNRIDWKKPYGSIFGSVDGLPGARFEQGGFVYDANGNRVDVGGSSPAAAGPKAKRQRKSDDGDEVIVAGIAVAAAVKGAVESAE